MRLQSWIIVALAALLFFPAHSRGESALFAPEGLRCEYLEDPLGIDVPQPRLSWRLNARDPSLRGLCQSAYQILVAVSPGGLARGAGDRWDSGRVPGESLQVEYGGQALASGTECFWKVRVWDAAGRVSPWSAPARWTMGLLRPEDWSGQWISGPSYPGPDGWSLPLLRKVFRVDRPVRRAMLYVTSLGYHRVDLNGQKVGDHEWDPVQSDYRRRVHYVAHEVTGQIVQGENAMGAGLGKGWYWKGIGGVSQDRPALRLELVLEFVDGSACRVASDASWKASMAPVRLTGGQRNAGGDFGSEVYDARRELPGWNGPGFDDRGWQAAETVDVPPVLCSAQMIAPNRVVARLPVVAIHEPASGQYVLDFGKNLTGRLRMKVTGSRGAEIAFAYYASHTGNSGALTEEFRQADRYICRGGPGEEFSSQFNWRAFRFVKVTGLPGRPAAADAVAELITTGLAGAGTFECSDPVLNRLHELVVHTHRCLTLGGIQVDCPHRERLGYGAEGQAGLAQAVYNFDAAAFYARWARDFRDGQDPESGLVYYTAPFRIHSGGGPAWSGACIVYPWTVYRFYGDRRALEEAYPSMRRWLTWLEGQSTGGRLRPYGLPEMGIWQFLGDWASPRRPDDSLPCNGHWATAEENRVFNDLHHYWQVTLVGRIAAILGREDEAHSYGQQADVIRQAINSAYFDSTAARYTRGEQQQTYLAFPLWLDVVPSGHRAAVLRNLVDDIVRVRRGHLDFGVLGGLYTMQALEREGRSDLIYGMVTRPGAPGWRNLMDLGATTLWEHWLPGDSSIHNSFLAVGGWLYSGLAGISPDEQAPGFRHVCLRPQPVPGLSWVKASYAGMPGTIESRWRVEGRRFTFEAVLPAGSTATVTLPASDPDEVTESGRPAATAPGVWAVGGGEGRAVFQIQSGRYQFVSTLPGDSW